MLSQTLFINVNDFLQDIPLCCKTIIPWKVWRLGQVSPIPALLILILFAKGRNQTNLFLIIHYWGKLIQQHGKERRGKELPMNEEQMRKKQKQSASDIAQRWTNVWKKREKKSLEWIFRLQSARASTWVNKK